MTGDGVNDLLALREADCSIAIGEGSDAARQVSQLVLLNSDFAALPDVLAEGRRVVNNVTRVASIFFVKTIYSAIISLLCVFLNIPFPFVPIRLRSSTWRLKVTHAVHVLRAGWPQDYRAVLPSVFRRALPNALAVVCAVAAVWLLAPGLALSAEMAESVMYLLLVVVSLAALFKSCWPFNKLRVFLLGTTAVGIFAAIYLFRDLLRGAARGFAFAYCALAGGGLNCARADIRLCDQPPDAEKSIKKKRASEPASFILPEDCW